MLNAPAPGREPAVISLHTTCRDLHTPCSERARRENTASPPSRRRSTTPSRHTKAEADDNTNMHASAPSQHDQVQAGRAPPSPNKVTAADRLHRQPTRAAPRLRRRGALTGLFNMATTACSHAGTSPAPRPHRRSSPRRRHEDLELRRRGRGRVERGRARPRAHAGARQHARAARRTPLPARPQPRRAPELRLLRTHVLPAPSDARVPC